ncbi:MAG TPA: ThuA domain-containing protein [Micromonosporaceae bacterium]
MTQVLRPAVGVALAALVLAACRTAPSAGPSAYDILVFSKTTGYRHESITAGVRAFRELGTANGFAVTATEDATAFTAESLRRYAAVVFLNTTGDVLDRAQRSTFEAYIRGGGGFVGVHSAADTEYRWPFYGGLVGAYFARHPAIQRATLRVEDRRNPATAHLGETWVRTDEWYDYRTNPRPAVRVLASLVESSYSGGRTGADHPIAWCHAYQGGRSFYTGGGHTTGSYAEPDFRAHLLGGLRYAAGRAAADCAPQPA